MNKNVAGQTVSAQMTTIADGSPFTGSVTVSVTGDAGTQATGSVGSGACTHEGKGVHSYAPAQAETNYDNIVFTFEGTGAYTVSVQVYTQPVKYPATLDEADVTGNLPANVEQFGGTNGTFSSGRPEVNVSHLAGNATAASNLRWRYFMPPWFLFTSVGTVTSQTIFAVDNGGSTVDDIYNGCIAVVRDSSGNWHWGIIADYDGTTQVITLVSAMTGGDISGDDEIMIFPPGALPSIPSDWINEAAFADDTSKYQAKVSFVDDDGGSADRYVVVWHKNGQPITSGITDPKLSVLLVSDGTALIDDEDMTEIASTGLYRYTATTTERITSGVGYVAEVSATIDGSTRTWFQGIGRDT